MKDLFKSNETDQRDANFMCYFASEFDQWVDTLHESSDKWLRMCALFVTMSKDFITFVDSYRSGDSIGIEVGYQAFAPVWRCLGQSRYLERH